MTQSTELAHYGVKGMKWGRRRGGDSSSGGGEKRLSRKEHRAKVKQDKAEFYQKKADNLLKEVLKEPISLVAVRDRSGQTTIATGKEFMDFAAKGGMFDIRYTDIYARPTSEGYQINADMNTRYKAPKR